MKKMQGIAVLAAGLSVTAAAHAQFATVAPHAKSIGGQGTIAQDEYMIDDGATDDLLGWLAGGTMAWIQWFDAAGGSDSITAIRIINGSALFPGNGNGNGSPVSVGIWSDPNGDGDPLDAVLLKRVDTTIQNADTDVYQTVAISPAQPVTGRFFIGAWITHSAGQYVAPMDINSSPEPDRAYIFGNYNGYGGSFNPNNPGDAANNVLFESFEAGFPTDFCVRANGDGGGGYSLVVTGSCPGTINLAWSGATPNKQQGIVFASSTGNLVVPNGPCEGTQLGLSAQNIQLVNTIGTGNGAGNVNGQVNQGACPGHLQLVTVNTPCVTSNVDDIPG